MPSHPPPGEILREWAIFEPFLNVDKIINIPIAKHHSLTGATLGMKNWYGILGGPRHQLHQKIHQSLVDLADFVRPTLTIIDCYRVLVRNGPTGGNLDDVALKKTLAAGTDPVALDAYVQGILEPGSFVIALPTDGGAAQFRHSGVREGKNTS